MEIIVQKFGGTSVADINRIKQVGKIIQNEINIGRRVVVVVSAQAGVTGSLIAYCNEVSKLDRLSSLKEYDAAIASGEIITAALLALHLQTIGLKAKSLQGWQVPFKTNNTHGNAQVKEIDSTKLTDLLLNNIIPIVTGFQGLSDEGDITTLGKGGSDTSAALIAAAVKAERCDIYTDVDGIYTADPRIVHNAGKIDRIDIDELCVLCSSGAKVLHPRAAVAAKKYKFNLRILSSFNPQEGTTTIIREKNMESRQVTAITSNKNLLKVILYYRDYNLFETIKLFSQESIPIEQTYNFTKDSSIIIANLIDKNKCEKILEQLKKDSHITEYNIKADISSVSIIGYGIKNDIEFIAELTRILNNRNIDIYSMDISDIKISFLINDTDNETAIKLLHDFCFKPV